MRHKTIKIASLAALAAGLIAVTATSGASAIPSTNPFPGFPESQYLVGGDCDSNDGLYTVAVTSSTVQVTQFTAPSANAGGHCTIGLSYDTTTETFYELNNTGMTLRNFDAATGALLSSVPISGPCPSPYGLVITNDGTAYTADMPKFCSVDLTTGVTTEISASGFNFGSIGYDPTTDTIFTFDYSNPVNVKTVDRLTGTQTQFATISAPAGEVACLTGGTGGRLTPFATVGFDTNGLAWIGSDTCNSTLYAWDPDTNEYWPVGGFAAAEDITDLNGVVYPAGTSVYVEALTVVPNFSYVPPVDPPTDAPADSALPATGIAMADVLTASLFAIALTLGGLALVGMRRRHLR